MDDYLKWFDKIMAETNKLTSCDSDTYTNGYYMGLLDAKGKYLDFKNVIKQKEQNLKEIEVIIYYMLKYVVADSTIRKYLDKIKEILEG